MSDVRYAVTVDSTGAVKAIEVLDRAFENLGKESQQTGNLMKQAADKSNTMWKSMAVGQLAADAVRKGLRAATQMVKDSIQGALEGEEAENRLKVAIESTGRSIEGNLAFYRKFALEKMKVTKHTDDEVNAASTLLLQLTNLDQKGITKAVEGAMGLSAVMGTDLHSATLMVTKAMEGNYTALQRVGITVSEGLSPQEKQAELLAKLGGLYVRAEAELDTFGGRLANLKNYWEQLRDSVGDQIINNESAREGMKKLAVGMDNMVKSDRFKLWLSALTDSLTWMVKALSDTVSFIIKVEDALLGAKGWEDYVAKTTEANASVIEGVHVHALRRRAIDQELITVKEWGEANKKAGHSSLEMVKQIKAGNLGPELQAMFEAMRAGAETAKKEAEALKPEINEVGDAARIAAKKSQELKTELQAVFSGEILAEIAKIEEGLATFGDSLTPASLAGFLKRLDELRAQISRPFTGVDWAAPVHDQTVSIIEDLYGVGLAAMFMKEKTAYSTQEFESGLAEVMAKAAAFDAQMKALAGPTMKDLQAAAADIRSVLRKAGDEMPTERVKELQEDLRRLEAMMRRDTSFDKWAAKANKAMETVQLVWGFAQQGLTNVFNQATTNRSIAIENEYKKRLEIINNTITDEEKKNAAIVALEAEFQIKRTSAAAAGAKQAKAVALMEAIVNTAAGVARAFKDFMFPLSAIIAGIVGGLGAVQIGLIAKQPIPLARGAVFTKRTRMTTEDGTAFEMGEAGAEYLIPEKHLAGLVKGRHGAPRGFAGAFAGGSGPVININSPLVRTSGLNDADLQAAGERLYRIVERRLRARGR